MTLSSNEINKKNAQKSSFRQQKTKFEQNNVNKLEKNASTNIKQNAPIKQNNTVNLKPNINELVARAKQNDSEAYNILINHYSRLVRAVSRRYYLLGGEQEDLIQEGMIGFYNAVRTYNPNSAASFSTFARICIDGQIKTAISRSHKVGNIALNEYVSINPKLDEDNEELGYLLISDELTPEEELLKYEQTNYIRTWLTNKLKLEERKILSLYLRGYSYVEIANELKISTKAVDNTLFGIRKKLSSLNLS